MPWLHWNLRKLWKACTPFSCGYFLSWISCFSSSEHNAEIPFSFFFSFIRFNIDNQEFIWSLIDFGNSRTRVASLFQLHSSEYLIHFGQVFLVIAVSSALKPFSQALLIEHLHVVWTLQWRIIFELSHIWWDPRSAYTGILLSTFRTKISGIIHLTIILVFLNGN